MAYGDKTFIGMNKHNDKKNTTTTATTKSTTTTTMMINAIGRQLLPYKRLDEGQSNQNQRKQVWSTNRCIHSN